MIEEPLRYTPHRRCSDTLIGVRGRRRASTEADPVAGPPTSSSGLCDNQGCERHGRAPERPNKGVHPTAAKARRQVTPGALCRCNRAIET